MTENYNASNVALKQIHDGDDALFTKGSKVDYLIDWRRAPHIPEKVFDKEWRKGENKMQSNSYTMLENPRRNCN